MNQRTLQIIGILSLSTFLLNYQVLGAQPPQSSCETYLSADQSIEISNRLTERLLQQVGKIQELEKYPVSAQTLEALKKRGQEVPHGNRYEVYGVPSQVKKIETKNVVFRHYIIDKEMFDSIKNSKVLFSGFKPYIQQSANLYVKTFVDLTGVFLTKPDVSPRNVGVDAHVDEIYYVDLKLPENLPVLEIEANEIYLVPLPKNYRKWMRDLYAKYKRGEKMPTHNLELCEKLRREGSIEMPISSIPVEIVGSGAVPR